MGGVQKCIITIVDDDGTNRTNDTYTGILSFLNTRNIPLTLAVPSESPSKSSGTYNLAQLHELESAGNEVIMHGVTNEDHARNMTQAEFETMTDTMIAWATENGFANDLFAYPGGAFVNNDDYGLNPKIEYLKTKGIKLAYGINQSVENALTAGYEDWYNYANGHEYGGVGNKVPFVTMPNGYSKALLANRMELIRDTLTKDWWRTRVRNFIENKVYITFYMHCWISEWRTPGDDDKTTTDLFEEFIQELIDDYGDQIEWKTASGALRSIYISVEEFLSSLTNDRVLVEIYNNDNTVAAAFYAKGYRWIKESLLSRLIDNIQVINQGKVRLFLQ